MRRPTLRHRLEYALFVAISWACGRLSDRWADRIGAALGRIAYRLGVRRDVATEQVRASFPQQAEAWVERVVRASYEHIGREAIAMVRMSGSDVRTSWLATSDIVGFERLHEAFRMGRGLVLVGGHLGTWELGAAALAARGLPVDAIAQRQANPLIDRALTESRARLGLRIFGRGGATRLALRSLREGRIVGFVADQDARRNGIFVDFFGRPASTHRGPALVAVRAGAPMFLGVPLRAPDGGYHLEAQEVRFDRGGDPESAIRRGTQAVTAMLEAAIRSAPEQYFWVHRRWKTRPPDPVREEPEPAGEV